MPRLSLHFLGMPRVLLDDTPVGVDRRKSVALLAYLAVTARALSRDALATLFWPEHDQVTARANLRRILSLLHAALHGEWLVIDRENAALPQAEGLWVDVIEFRRCLSECRTSGHPDPAMCPQCVAQLEAAAALYTDDFLAGFTLPDAPEFDDWQFRQTETLRSELSDALSRLIRCQSWQGNFDAAIAHARRRVALDPLHEPSQRQLMEALARSGDKAGALRQYQALTDLLRRELAAAPARETAELARIISEDRLPPVEEQVPRVAATPAVSADGIALNGHSARADRERPRRHNLPAEVNSFVGREGELAELARFLAEPACRLITIVGPGGMGKTRLALHAAEAQMGRFEEGVYLVNLTAVSAREFIAQSIAAALGVSLQGARDPWAALLGLLSTQQVLLVLDNLEQLLPDVDFVTELLQAAPRLKILATSRERLNLQSEWIYDLGGLRYPAPTAEALAMGADVEAFSAAALFVQRAQQQRRGFSVGDELPCILEICRLVEGMPLALELAAGWTRTMACREIADELARGIDILATTHRDVPGRHRSMSAVFDHSWGLLTEPQQAAFRRLSVFRGGWTSDAAEAVAGADLRMLSVLIDKSLIHRDASGRWGMHELVRQYAAHRLRAAGEEDDISARHAAFFEELTERAEPELVLANQTEWMSRLDAEQGNIRSALRWSFLEGDCRYGLGSAGALHYYWHLRGQRIEGSWWLEQAVECGRALGATRELARALSGLGLHLAFMGQLGRARELCEEGIVTGLAVGAGAELEVVHCRISIAYINVVEGHAAQARSTLEELLTYYRQLASDGQESHLQRLTWVLAAYSMLAFGEGKLDEALAALHEALPIQREIADRQGLATNLESLGCITLIRGDVAQARTYFQEGLALSRELSFVSLLMSCAEGMAAVYAADGEFKHAVVILGAANVLRCRTQTVPPGKLGSVYDSIIAQTVAALGQQEYDRLFRVGQGMTLEEALDASVIPGPQRQSAVRESL